MAFIVKDRNFDPDRPLFYEGARLYILVRTDIAQLNPGKLGAQAAHAGTQFVFDVLDDGREELVEEMNSWRQQAGGGFGTKITLAATEDEIKSALADMARWDLQTGLVVDPTYPMLNYFDVPFTREELTCGYVFMPHTAPKEALEALKVFKLHP